MTNQNPPSPSSHSAQTGNREKAITKPALQSLPAYAVAVPFIMLGWIFLDFLTGSLFQAYILPACLVISCLLLMKASSQKIQE